MSKRKVKAVTAAAPKRKAKRTARRPSPKISAKSIRGYITRELKRMTRDAKRLKTLAKVVKSL